MEGFIRPGSNPSLIHSFGAVEQWNGNLGPGPLNAIFATDRAAGLASASGIGMVTLANTNHWMRAGTYGLRAARQGAALICWTNTCPNMPAWGAKDARLGNNPCVFSVPFGDSAVVLDFAMTLFSYGKMENYRNAGRELPFPGGYSTSGAITNDPSEILKSWRPLPAGYWKGSGLSLLLDIMAAVLSGGQATYQVGSCSSEYAVSQVFIAFNLGCLHNYSSIGDTISAIISDLKKSIPSEEESPVRYPGERMVELRNDNNLNGIAVDKALWTRICSL
jgi:3-dehydro-L-gulonate 2-dehydrogenase